MSAECPICAYADEHGSWPADHKGTHCRDCHRSWTALAAAHCTVCCHHFTSDGVATLHWRAGRHLDPVSVPGLYCGPDGVWSTSPDRDPDALRERLAAGRRNARITPSHRAQSPATGPAGPFLPQATHGGSHGRCGAPSPGTAA